MPNSKGGFSGCHCRGDGRGQGRAGQGGARGGCTGAVHSSSCTGDPRGGSGSMQCMPACRRPLGAGSRGTSITPYLRGKERVPLVLRSRHVLHAVPAGRQAGAGESRLRRGQAPASACAATARCCWRAHRPPAQQAQPSASVPSPQHTIIEEEEQKHQTKKQAPVLGGGGSCGSRRPGRATFGSARAAAQTCDSPLKCCRPHQTAWRAGPAQQGGQGGAFRARRQRQQPAPQPAWRPALPTWLMPPNMELPSAAGVKSRVEACATAGRQAGGTGGRGRQEWAAAAGGSGAHSAAQRTPRPPKRSHSPAAAHPTPRTRVSVHQQLCEGHVGLQDVQQLEAQARAVDGEHVACGRGRTGRGGPGGAAARAAHTPCRSPAAWQPRPAAHPRRWPPWPSSTACARPRRLQAGAQGGAGVRR